MNRLHAMLAVGLVGVGAGIGLAQTTTAPATGSATGSVAATGPATTAATTTAPGRRGRGAVDTRPYGPAALPGKGLAEFNFMYAGEATPLKISMVKEGKVDWQYTHPKPARGGGEISDASMLPNGNVLFAFQFGAAIVTPEKKVIWSVDAEAPTEIHTAAAVGTDKVAYIINGNPAKLVVANITTSKTESSFELPTGNPNSVHGQFRHVRYTAAGTFLVAHMDSGKVVEYDKDGKSLWSVAIASPWAAVRLDNGNTLITTNGNLVREVKPTGETAWEFRAADVPEYRIFGTQTAVRLANGNTLINNWHGKDAGGEPVQFFEVTPEKKVVWALREWTEPNNLGTSTNIQLLDAAGKPDPAGLQR